MIRALELSKDNMIGGIKFGNHFLDIENISS